MGLRSTGNTRDPMLPIGQSMYLATASGELWEGTWGAARYEDWTPGEATVFRPTAFLAQVTDLALPSALPLPSTSPPPELPFQSRIYRIKPAADLAAALQNGDLSRVWKVLQPLSYEQLNQTLIYAGFSIPYAKTKAELLAHSQSALIAAAQAEAILTALELSRHAEGVRKARRTPGTYLLTGLLKTPDQQSWYGDGKGAHYRVYWAGKKSRWVPREALEQAVVRHVIADLTSPIFIRMLLKEARKI